MPTECRYAEYKEDLAVEAMWVAGLVYTDETRKTEIAQEKWWDPIRSHPDFLLSYEQQAAPVDGY